MSASLAEQLAELTPQDRAYVFEHLTIEQKASLRWDWTFWARANQIEPEGDQWLTWLILAGRGYGKTRTGAETIRDWACGPTPLAGGKYGRFALVAETSADARDVMVEGESGILACHPKAFRPTYEPSKRRLTWPNGAVATLYNAVEPDQLRGPQHDAAWCDELAKWRYAQATWEQLQLGLRIGPLPRCIITTTPRPIPVLKTIMADPTTVITRGSTRENVGNLAPSFMKQIFGLYEGTRLGRQELEAEILDDVPGALWTRRTLDEHRLGDFDDLPDLVRIVVGVDPATTSNDKSNETGIVACGIGPTKDGWPQGYVLDDVSLVGTPEEWAKAAIALYRRLEADCIVAEVNQGGEMVEAVIRSIDPNVPVKQVRATRGKYMRAEPVSSLYEQGRIHHVGAFSTLEDQMCIFTPDFDRSEGSPDRLDALVWAFTNLFGRLIRPLKKEKNQENNPWKQKIGANWMAG